MDGINEGGDYEGWVLSSPTSLSTPVEFTVGSSRWSLQAISGPHPQRSPTMSINDVTQTGGSGPQWTFQHVDSTSRNTIVPSRAMVSNNSVATAFPISGSSTAVSIKSRPRIVIDSPPVATTDLPDEPNHTSRTPMFPRREKTPEFDSPLFGLFHALLPLSPALSPNQVKLISGSLRSPATPNARLMLPPPSATSGSTISTPRATIATSTPSPLSSLFESDSATDCEAELEETNLLRQTLDSLDGKLRELLEERLRVQGRLVHAASKRSPISRLPTEILARVFELGMNEDEDRRGIRDRIDFGLDSVLGTGGLFLDVVCRVCKIWKEVAESTPSLWSTIVISSHNSLKTAQRRLERSRSVPLDIQIDLADRIALSRSSLFAGELASSFDLLEPQAHRWRTLRIQVSDHTRAQVVFKRSAQFSAPLLESFSVQVDQGRTIGPDELPWLFDYTPALRGVSLSSVHVGWSTRPFNNLSSLCLSDYWNEFAPSAQQLLDILGSCANTLTDLTLRNILNSGTDEGQLEQPGDIPCVALPRLKRAAFHFVESSRLSALVGRLQLQALERLELSYLDEASTLFEVLCQQEAGNLPLKALKVVSSLVDENCLVRLLSRLPELTVLELPDCEDVTSRLLNELSDSDDWLCPKLSLLSIDGCTAIDSQSVRTFVTSRLPSQQSEHPTAQVRPVPVDELCVSRCLGISSDAVQWLRMYVPVVHREP